MNDAIGALLEEGVSARLFPGAAVSVRRAGTWHHWCTGRLGYEGVGGPWDEVTPRSVYDLASLTKALATSLVAGWLMDQGALDLDRPIEHYVPGLAGFDQGEVTCRQLLSHCAGYPGWKPYYEARGDHKRLQLLAEAAREGLVCPPGARAEYSDVGYMVLTLVLEMIAGTRLDVLFSEHVAQPLSLHATTFLPVGEDLTIARERVAPTSECPWRGKLLHCEVEDDNTWALGGISGQAGVFSCLEDLEVLAGHLWRIHRGEDGVVKSGTLARLWTKQSSPEGTSWALGWDTPVPPGQGSLVGEKFSRNAVGMWGFTGTGLWLDFERELIVISLTNRVHPSRQAGDISEFRRALHDAACDLAGLA